LRERSNASVPAGTTRVCGKAVPAQKYLRKRRSYAFLHYYTPGASTGGGLDATCVFASKLGSGEENYTLKGEEFPQIYGLYVKSKTLDSCRFETKMCQNAPNPISISISISPPLGALPPDPRGGEGRAEGKGQGAVASTRL